MVTALFTIFLAIFYMLYALSLSLSLSLSLPREPRETTHHSENKKIGFPPPFLSGESIGCRDSVTTAEKN